MTKQKIILLTLALMLSLALASIAYAQGGGGYDLSWWTVDGGGEEVSGGGFTLNGTAGQADAHSALTGGGFSLTGGFWTPEGATTCAVPLTGIHVIGSSSGQPNVALVYTADPQPVGAASPITYTWSTDGLQSGQGTASATYLWTTEGNKSVQLAAKNCGGQTFNDTQGVTISAACAVPITGTEITGQTAGVVNVNYTFAAGFTPANATGPVTYVWSSDGLQSGQGTANATYQWSSTGAHAVSVTTSNCGGSVNDSHTITLSAQGSCAVPLNSVTINGATSGEKNKAYTFTASIDPLNATTPITYVWSSDNLQSGQGTTQAVYRWAQAGDYNIALSAANCGGGKSDTHAVKISGFKIFLPLVLK